MTPPPTRSKPFGLACPPSGSASGMRQRRVSTTCGSTMRDKQRLPSAIWEQPIRNHRCCWQGYCLCLSQLGSQTSASINFFPIYLPNWGRSLCAPFAFWRAEGIRPKSNHLIPIRPPNQAAGEQLLILRGGRRIGRLHSKQCQQIALQSG